MRSRVVHCKRETHDIYIGRPGKWGNPFEIGRDGTREEVIVKYARWIVDQKNLMDALPELRGKVLGCWCAPKACHGHVLANLVDGLDVETALRLTLARSSENAPQAQGDDWLEAHLDKELSIPIPAHGDEPLPPRPMPDGSIQVPCSNPLFSESRPVYRNDTANMHFDLLESLLRAALSDKRKLEQERDELRTAFNLFWDEYAPSHGLDENDKPTTLRVLSTQTTPESTKEPQ